MRKPTDNSRRPARPERRFSAIKRPVKRPDEAADAEAAEAGEPSEGDEGGPEPASSRSPAAAAKPAPAPDGTGEGGKRSDEARVAKVMSRAGVCSRREAEAWIMAGRVAVNGRTIDGPALNIGPGDEITVDGYPIEKPERTRLFMFHKTRGLVTTARDPEGRPTVFDALPADLPRLITIGRLDINTEGLLLLTNDGGLARLLELPSTGWLRRYRVRANGHIDQTQLDALAKGVSVDGVDYAGIDARLDRIQGANVWLTLGLREGKNREVKRVLEHLGLAVTRLIRISFGPFQLGDLAENAVEEVRTRVLRDQLGSALAKQAGLDLRTAEEAQAPPAPAPAPEPRRKTSRTATADRRGRAVAVERIASVDRPPARGAPARAATPAEETRRAPSRAGRPAESRDGSTAAGEARRPRTLRQADADAERRETRSEHQPRDGRGTRPARADERRPGGAAVPKRSEGPRFGGRTRDSERPRTGRNKDEFRGGPRQAPRSGGAPRTEERPRPPRTEGGARSGTRSDERPRPPRPESGARSGARSDERPRVPRSESGARSGARSDERPRVSRSEGGFRSGPSRGDRPGRGEGSGAPRPGGGRPPSRGGGNRPGGKPGGSGGKPRSRG